MVQLESPKSMADQVYFLLKKEILEEKIKPRTRITQEIMAKRYNISRTPIREAFKYLERDGLVEKMPQGGMRVRSMNIKTIKEVYGVRSVLESYAVELACKNFTDDDFQFLNKIRAEALDIIESNEIDTDMKFNNLLKLNSLFHGTIYKISNNSYLIKILEEMKNSILIARSVGLQDKKHWKLTWEDHGKIIECLQKRDVKRCQSIITEHVQWAVANVIDYLKE